MPLSLQKKNGFTLIELMIVAAVLAILVVIVIIAQKTTVLRSKDTRIITSVAEARKMAEKIYVKEGTGYLGFCDQERFYLNLSNEELRILQKDIEENGGETYCYSNQNSYCLGVKLFSGKFFCIDDETNFGSTMTQKCIDGNTICTIP